jgi:hypothetical protein
VPRSFGRGTEACHQSLYVEGGAFAPRALMLPRLRYAQMALRFHCLLPCAVAHLCSHRQDGRAPQHSVDGHELQHDVHAPRPAVKLVRRRPIVCEFLTHLCGAHLNITTCFETVITVADDVGCPCRSGCAGAWSDKRWVDKWRGIELTRRDYGPNNPAVLEVVRIHDERAALVGWHCTTEPGERLRAGDRVIRKATSPSTPTRRPPTL